MRFWFLFFAVPAAVGWGAPVVPPVVLDPALQISLVAAEPEINTPVGIAVDRKGRLFVAESNTHHVKPDYKGPTTDRIRVFEDTDGDGKREKVTTFSEGHRHAMCLKFDPDGVLHLTRRNALLKLEDLNGDGVCDRETTLLRWETGGDYPHNGLSGMAFSPDGWLYVGSGENLGAVYTAIGADDRKIVYQPGGANVFRIRRDGSRLELVATGMWNAFGLECDGAGRILAVDNDPDSCPPNRLLHIVPAGDYGYNFTYGRSGQHPFQCWNGELPGTLPMICGVGEAATDVLDLRRTALRKAGLNVMVTSWGDNQLEVYHLVPSTHATVTLGERTVVVRGDASFRPACLAAAPDGSVYITDWADREYSVHGMGRIWHLRANSPAAVKVRDAVLERTAAENQAVTLTESKARPDDMRGLERMLSGKDPFLRAAAVANAVRLEFSPELAPYLTAANPVLRAEALAAMRFAGQKIDSGTLRKLIMDNDAAVTRMALIEATERRLKELKPDIEAALQKHPGDRGVFRTAMAALELIDKGAAATPAGTGTNDPLLIQIMTDVGRSPEIRALAMLYVNDRRRAAPHFLSMLKDPIPAVAAAAARAVGGVNEDNVNIALRELSANSSAPVPVRIDAMAALAGKPDDVVLALLPLVQDADVTVARQAVRTLRGSIGDGAVKEAFETRYADTSADPALREALALSLGKPALSPRPADDPAWHAALANVKGSPDEGRRVFFSASSLCSTCHVAEGRGTTVGPDLSTIARALDRKKLLDSILVPSREIGPLYLMKTATLKDGRVISGVQSLRDSGTRLDLIQPGGAVMSAQTHEIAKLDIAPVSLMPEALELALTVKEMGDLLAFMETLK